MEKKGQRLKKKNYVALGILVFLVIIAIFFFFLNIFSVDRGYSEDYGSYDYKINDTETDIEENGETEEEDDGLFGFGFPWWYWAVGAIIIWRIISND